MFNLFKKNKPKPKAFLFREPSNTACYVCDHVLERKRPILMVSHDENGEWQFLCGHDDHLSSNLRIISLQQATELDESINALYEMPISVGATRDTADGQWVPFRIA